MSNRSSSRLICAVSFMLASAAARAQDADAFYDTCWVPGLPLCDPSPPIPDAAGTNTPGTPAVLELEVPYDDDHENIVTDVDVHVRIVHSYQGDLRITLTSPEGTAVTLMDRPGYPGTQYGFSSDNLGRIDCPTEPCNIFQTYINPFILNDEAPFPYDSPPVPYPGLSNVVGQWKPHAPLSAFDGEAKFGTWTLRVWDYAQGDTGTLVWFGLNLQSEPLTPPIATISQPAPQACACNPMQIRGSAYDPDGSFDEYRVEYSANPGGPWTLIHQSSSEVFDGVLAIWNTSSVTEGLYFLRLTATNGFSQSAQFVTIVHVDRVFSGLEVRSPEDHTVIGGQLCLDGTAWDVCFESYQVLMSPDGGPFTQVYASAQPVLNDPILQWNTASVPDGDYVFRVNGATSCDNTQSIDVPLTIDNTAPVAQLYSPSTCSTVSGVVQVMGAATDANLAAWTLQVTGGPYNGMVHFG